MRGNTALLLQEKAEHTQQIRSAIGRRLREQYDAAQPPSGRLADLVKKIEQPNQGARGEIDRMRPTGRGVR
jgi:hypothetical protein